VNKASALIALTNAEGALDELAADIEYLRRRIEELPDDGSLPKVRRSLVMKIRRYFDRVFA